MLPFATTLVVLIVPVEDIPATPKVLDSTAFVPVMVADEDIPPDVKTPVEIKPA